MIKLGVCRVIESMSEVGKEEDKKNKDEEVKKMNKLEKVSKTKNVSEV
jgi:hypothetical protein